MKKFILSESGLKKINAIIIKESYNDKVLMVKDYLDKNYKSAPFEQNGETVGIFYKLSNGIPTEKTLWKKNILQDLDKEYYKMITDKKERDGFLNQVVDDWYYKRKGLENGTLSSYNW